MNHKELTPEERAHFEAAFDYAVQLIEERYGITLHAAVETYRWAEERKQWWETAKKHGAIGVLSLAITGLAWLLIGGVLYLIRFGKGGGGGP